MPMKERSYSEVPLFLLNLEELLLKIEAHHLLLLVVHHLGQDLVDLLYQVMVSKVQDELVLLNFDVPLIFL